VIIGREPLCDHVRGHPRGAGRGGEGRAGRPGEDPEVLGTDAVLGALARREHRASLVGQRDPAVRLLGALIDDVDQRLSSVSITPST